MTAVAMRLEPPTLRRTLGIFGRPFAQVPEYLRGISRDYGPIVKFANPLVSYFFVDDAQFLEDVFVTKSAAFMKGRGTQRLKALLGDGLLTAVQPEHLKHRRLVQPAFHRSRIDAFGQVIVDYTRARVESWQPGSTIDVHHETMQLALEIVARTLFGSDLSHEKQAISGALDDALEVFPLMLMPFSELIENLPLPPILRFKRARRTLDRVVYDMMREHRADGEDRGDLLSMLMESEVDGVRFTDVQVHDEALTILLAGHETTANALAWTFYLLQRHPQIEAKLVAHLSDVLGDRDPELDDFAKLDYVRAVVSESMRLYPPAWLTGRRALEDTTIGDYAVRKGEIVLVSQYVTHRNPRYWDEPERFDPERWLAGGGPKEKFAYFPFGGGNRLCIGERFAWLELIFAVSTIVRHVRFERTDALDIEPEPLVTMRPKSPVHARVTRR